MASYTIEQQAQRVASKKKRESDMVSALSKVLTKNWILYENLHHELNKIMRVITNNPKFDAELIHLSQSVKKFSDTIRLIKWKEERYGRYQAQTNYYVRLAV